MRSQLNDYMSGKDIPATWEVVGWTHIGCVEAYGRLSDGHISAARKPAYGRLSDGHISAVWKFMGGCRMDTYRLH